jgi:hypothetical protein
MIARDVAILKRKYNRFSNKENLENGNAHI